MFFTFFEACFLTFWLNACDDDHLKAFLYIFCPQGEHRSRAKDLVFNHKNHNKTSHSLDQRPKPAFIPPTAGPWPRSRSKAKTRSLLLSRLVLCKRQVTDGITQLLLTIEWWHYSDGRQVGKKHFSELDRKLTPCVLDCLNPNSERWRGFSKRRGFGWEKETWIYGLRVL